MRKKSKRQKSLIALIQMHDEISRCILIEKNRQSSPAINTLRGNVFLKLLNLLCKQQKNISQICVVYGTRRFSLVRVATLLANVLSVTWKIPISHIMAPQNASAREIITLFEKKVIFGTSVLIPRYAALPNITVAKR